MMELNHWNIGGWISRMVSITDLDFQLLLASRSLNLVKGNRIHAEFVFKILTNHCLSVFLRFRFFVTVDIVTFVAYLILETKAAHPPEYGGHRDLGKLILLKELLHGV